jgi:nucleoside-diphosphate-sugar epimerase
MGEINGGPSGAIRTTVLISALVLGVMGWAGRYVADQAIEANRAVEALRGEFGGDLRVIKAELERAKQDVTDVRRDVTEIRRLVERIDSRSRKREEQP